MKEAARSLIVEDTETDRAIMRRVVTRQCPGQSFIFAKNLTDARKILDEQRIHFVFLDNTLPDGRGADFVAELAEHPKWKRLPVVIVSDWPSPFLYAKAKAFNVREIWTKSEFKGPEILRVIGAHAIVA